MAMQRPVMDKSLTPGRAFTLKYLSQKEATGAEISEEAMKNGLNNKRDGVYEWADPYLYWLRGAGYIEHTGKRFQGHRLHRITEFGKKALALI